MTVKDTKSSILRPVFHLVHCNSTNGLKERGTNKTIPKMHFARHRYVVEFVESAKGPTFWQNGGQNKKIFNVEANFPFGTL
jgi:hypothetical protein